MGKTKKGMIEEDEQIEEAKVSLERINSWINSCDSKAGTVLALVGVIWTIIFTNDGILTMKNLINQLLPPKSFCMILYLLFLSSTLLGMIYGVIHLINVLIAKIDVTVFAEQGIQTSSVLFFGSISNKNSYLDFKREVLNLNKQAYLNDLLSQIYINSKIAQKKYENYNKGIKWTILGFVMFIAFLLIGLYLY